MIIWKQYLGELTEISPDALPAELLEQIRAALPDDEEDCLPYVNPAWRLIAVTNRVWEGSKQLLYTPTEEGACALAGIGLADVDHIVIPLQNDEGQTCTEVAGSAFLYESCVKSVTFMGSVAVRDMAFWGCDSLEQVTICGVLAELGERAFGDCTALTRFVGWDAMVQVGQYAFRGCTALERFSAHRVCAMEEEAFSGCESLKALDCALEITHIPSSAFESCNRLSAVTLSEGIRGIGRSAFDGCKSLAAVRLPEGMTYIHDYAFCGCSTLQEIVVPYSVESIGDNAFRSCTGLTHLRIPHRVARDALLDDEDIRRFTDFYRLYNPDGWESYNVGTDQNLMAGVEFYKLNS